MFVLLTNSLKMKNVTSGDIYYNMIMLILQGDTGPMGPLGSQGEDGERVTTLLISINDFIISP